MRVQKRERPSDLERPDTAGRQGDAGMRQKAALKQAIETLQKLDLVRRRIKKLEKHLQIAQLHVRMIESELRFEEKRRRTA